MILLYVNAFKDVTNDQSSQHQKQPIKNKINFFSANLTKSNIIVLKNVLIYKKQPDAFVRVLYLLKQSPAYKKEDPIVLISRVLDYLRPLITFRFKKVAGVRHRLPFIKTRGTTRDQFQAVCWLLEAVSKRSELSKEFSVKLFEEVVNVLNHRGFSVRSRYLYHKSALNQRPALKFL